MGTRRASAELCMGASLIVAWSCKSDGSVAGLQVAARNETRNLANWHGLFVSSWWGQ